MKLFKDDIMRFRITGLPRPYAAFAEIEAQTNYYTAETSYAVHISILDRNEDDLIYPYVWSVEPYHDTFRLKDGLFGPRAVRSYLISEFGADGLHFLKEVQNDVTDCLRQRYAPYDYSPFEDN